MDVLVEGLILKKNKIKKRLGIKKEQLILLATYKVFGMEFKYIDEAMEFVDKMMQWERNENEQW